MALERELKALDTEVRMLCGGRLETGTRESDHVRGLAQIVAQVVVGGTWAASYSDYEIVGTTIAGRDVTRVHQEGIDKLRAWAQVHAAETTVTFATGGVDVGDRMRLVSVGPHGQEETLMDVTAVHNGTTLTVVPIKKNTRYVRTVLTPAQPRPFSVSVTLGGDDDV